VFVPELDNSVARLSRVLVSPNVMIELSSWEWLVVVLQVVVLVEAVVQLVAVVSVVYPRLYTGRHAVVVS
jgi:hypothetical protein